MMPFRFLSQKDIGHALGRKLLLGSGVLLAPNHRQTGLPVLGNRGIHVPAIRLGDSQAFAQQFGHGILEFAAALQSAKLDLLDQGIRQIERRLHGTIFWFAS
jgi:hypothetical protein